MAPPPSPWLALLLLRPLAMVHVTNKNAIALDRGEASAGGLKNVRAPEEFQRESRLERESEGEFSPIL